MFRNRQIHVVNGSGRNEQSLQRTFHRCFLPSFGSFRQAVSEEKIFKNQQYLYRDNCILNTDIYIPELAKIVGPDRQNNGRSD
jgi:hypothetical protein